jgi:hypothetical protein
MSVLDLQTMKLSTDAAERGGKSGGSKGCGASVLSLLLC